MSGRHSLIISDEMPTIDEYDLRTFSHSHPLFDVSSCAEFDARVHRAMILTMTIKTIQS